jgi:hydrogenase nickel incorporation protein HypA/HybF
LEYGGGEVHELSIAQEILELSHSAMAERGGDHLERVLVAVGELTAIEPDLLRFAWEALTKDGPDEGCELEVDWRPAVQHCEQCGDLEGHRPGDWVLTCPTCGGPLRIQGGQELDLLQVSFEVP